MHLSQLKRTGHLRLLYRKKVLEHIYNSEIVATINYATYNKSFFYNTVFHNWGTLNIN